MEVIIALIFFWGPIVAAAWLFLKWYAKKNPEKIEAARRAPGRTEDQGEYLDLLSIDISSLAAHDRRERDRDYGN